MANREFSKIERVMKDFSLGIGEEGGSGTSVVANPTLVGDEPNLEGLQVGEQKYKVGGSGSRKVRIYIDANVNIDSLDIISLPSEEFVKTLSIKGSKTLEYVGFDTTTQKEIIKTKLCNYYEIENEDLQLINVALKFTLNNTIYDSNRSTMMTFFDASLLEYSIEVDTTHDAVIVANNGMMIDSDSNVINDLNFLFNEYYFRVATK